VVFLLDFLPPTFFATDGANVRPLDFRAARLREV
jgi:hypothetical protein